jgi:hypothetical protein
MMVLKVYDSGRILVVETNNLQVTVNNINKHLIVIGEHFIAGIGK